MSPTLPCSLAHSHSSPNRELMSYALKVFELFGNLWSCFGVSFLTKHLIKTHTHTRKVIYVIYVLYTKLLWIIMNGSLILDQTHSLQPFGFFFKCISEFYCNLININKARHDQFCGRTSSPELTNISCTYCCVILLGIERKMWNP